MVRVNIIKPEKLADQHLIAEYLEIMMLVGHAVKYPNSKIPDRYCLGPGHINFFKNKIGYLKKRHGLICSEMKRRGFRVNKKLDLSGIPKRMIRDWTPEKGDNKIIKTRLREKIKMKPGFYRYYGEIKGERFLIGLLKD